MLLEKIRQKHEASGMTDKDFAQKVLRIPRSTWQRTRTGAIPLGPTVAKAAGRAFPDLTADVVYFLLSDASRLAAPAHGQALAADMQEASA